MITPESVLLLHMHVLSYQISIDLDFLCNTVSIHGIGRISPLILKLIITCMKGRRAVLSFSLYSWLVHTQHQAWKEILSQLCLLQLADSRKRFCICRSHFSAVPFKKINIWSLAYLFRSLNERTLKLRFSRCPRACLALKNQYFVKGKAVHSQKTK